MCPLTVGELVRTRQEHPCLHGPEGLSAEADVKQNHMSTWVINNDSHKGEACGAESSQGTGVREERIC